MIQAPKINTSRFQDILEQAKALVPFYAPECEITEDKTEQVALFKIFAHMVETVISRLNQVPDKNLIAFLDMLGIQLIPAQSARAPLTFILSKGASENVLILERSQAAAGEIIFETEKNFLATPAKLVGAFSLNTDSDGIYKSPSTVIEGNTVSLLSSHLTYSASKGDKEFFLDDVTGLDKGDLLRIGEEYMEVSELSGKMVSITDGLSRDFKATTPAEKVTIFDLFIGKNLQEHILYLGHKDLFNIKPVDSPSSLSLRFKVLDPGAAYLTYEWSYWGEDKNTKKDAWIVSVIEEDSTTRITKSGDVKLKIGSEIKETSVGGIKSRWLRCKLLSSKAPITGTSRLPALEEISVVMENEVIPEMAFHNDVPLDLTIDEKTGNFSKSFHLFGKVPRLFETFNIGSSEAFSKKGAAISLTFSVAGVSPVADILVEEIYGIGPTFAMRLKEEGIDKVSKLLKYAADDLMGILHTTKRNEAINILTAAKKQFREATRDVVKESSSTREKPTLSWEYWNGKGWMVLKDLTDQTSSLLNAGKVFFQCPDDIEATQVGGQDNYWIRVRIVGGDYGQELIYNSTNNAWVGNTVNPPIFNKITVTYAPSPQKPDYCMSYNNLEYLNITEENKTTGKLIKPFHPLEDEYQTLYLGFDKVLESGPISIFFSVEEAWYKEETTPRIVWEYFIAKDTGGEWSRLEVLDGTRNLTRSGTIEFVLPEDFSSTAKFGERLYWLRGRVDSKNKFQSLSSIIAKVSKTILAGNRRLPGTAYQASTKDLDFAGLAKLVDTGKTKESPRAEIVSPCAPSVVIFNPAWSYPAEIRKYSLNPRIGGIYLNTTWAIQAETVKDEILGSSTGLAKQTFFLTKIPVISEDVRVNEINALSELEMKEILANEKLEAKEIKDDKGNVTAFWVTWQAVDDLLASSKTDRHYEIDRISGTVKFGDGINGAIPLAGSDNIKADYRIGGGLEGNIGSTEITSLKTSLPFVDKVNNPVAAAGGADDEPLEEATERGPQVVRHRNRAVTREDFEWLAKQSSSAIARAKCLPNFNDKGKQQPGWVTVIIVPESDEEQPEPSSELKSRVERYLKDCTANTVVSPEHLQVSAPVYVSVGVEADIVAMSMDLIPLVEMGAISRLKEFLHPLSGGYDGKGWDFGRSPCLSDFFALLESVDGVDFVETLTLRIKAGNGQSVSEYTITPERVRDIEMPPYTLVYSGKHRITVTFKKES